MSNFKIHSHACFEVKTSRASLLVDPWLIGSCYWRSWWNYPPVKDINFEKLNPNVIYITHVHWDHWHGPSLRKFLNKDILIVTHDEPNKRSRRDLENFGFSNIKILKHNEVFEFEDIKITPYQFGLFLNDSALVVETENLKILNANDCKIAGQSLEQIKRNHGKFDFALRSHSSANDRVCYEIIGSQKSFDDPEHYSRSFKLFMDSVKPRYAIPFASNHCHLHKDVFHFNNIINDPYQLERVILKNGGLESSKFKIMLSGDSYDTMKGFEINDNKKYFNFKEKYLLQYADVNKVLLNDYYKKESKQKLNKRTLKKFESQLDSIPRFLKRKLKGWKFLVLLSKDDDFEYLEVNPYNSIVQIIEDKDLSSYSTKIYIPLIIFNDAVNMNMFHHAGISKRNKYVFQNESELEKWDILNKYLEKIELEVFPLTFNYFINFTKTYVRRWREIIVYIKALFYLNKGLKIYDVEEKILKK